VTYKRLVSVSSRSRLGLVSVSRFNVSRPSLVLRAVMSGLAVSPAATHRRADSGRRDTHVTTLYHILGRVKCATIAAGVSVGQSVSHTRLRLASCRWQTTWRRIGRILRLIFAPPPWRPQWRGSCQAFGFIFDTGETRLAGLQSGEDRTMIDSVVWAQYINVTDTSPQQTQ